MPFRQRKFVALTRVSLPNRKTAFCLVFMNNRPRLLGAFQRLHHWSARQKPRTRRPDASFRGASFGLSLSEEAALHALRDVRHA